MSTMGQNQMNAHGLMKNSILSATKTTQIGTWNVRTLFQTGKMAHAIREFGNYGLDTVGLKEVRWTGSGKIMDVETTVLYSGPNECHERGVSIMLNKEASKALIGWSPVNDRIITARLQKKHSETTVTTVYAPTEDSDED